MPSELPIPKCSAFSLIELLVVVAILGLLAAVALPAFTNIGQAWGVTEAAYQIAAAVDFAREEARTRRAYVWLGIETNTDGLRVGAAMAQDGSASTNSLIPLMRPQVLQRVTLATAGSLDVSETVSGGSDFSANTGGPKFERGFTSGRTLTITPSGEVLTVASPTDADGFEPLVVIGLRAARGGGTNSENDAAVVIDGSSALPRVIRK